MNQATLNAAGAAFAASALVMLTEAIAQRFGLTIISAETAPAIGILTVVIHHYCPWIDTTNGEKNG
jgi:hypothetical protein